ncbi:hypothetical protein RR11_565 [Ruegeria sp. R11]|nr:hypothetical protein RR11_565 [Ruegeria sp. R11]
MGRSRTSLALENWLRNGEINALFPFSAKNCLNSRFMSHCNIQNLAHDSVCAIHSLREQRIT